MAHLASPVDASDSSQSGGGKTVSPLVFSDVAPSSSKNTSSPKTPVQLPRPLRRQSGLKRLADDDGTEHIKHHRVFSLMFLLAIISLFIVWSLDICVLSIAKRMNLREPLRIYTKPVSATPTPINSMELRLDGVATEAKNRVTEFFEAAGNFRCPQPRRYTREEVARHSSADDLWIVIDSNVLDVSPFVDQHPGGSVLLDGAGGQDMAAVFARSHHPSTVSLFSSFCIGRIAET